VGQPLKRNIGCCNKACADKEKAMRTRLSLPIFFPVLFCFGTVAAQGFLDEYKDKNDPCDRFKMRILMPVNNANHTLPIKKSEGGIDYKMVWNPCPQNEPQTAYVPRQLAPDWQRNFSVQRTDFGPLLRIWEQRTSFSSRQLSSLQS
jgi:hypothetical protein